MRKLQIQISGKLGDFAKTLFKINRSKWGKIFRNFKRENVIIKNGSVTTKCLKIAVD